MRGGVRGRVAGLGVAAAFLASACVPSVPPAATRQDPPPAPTTAEATAAEPSSRPPPSALDLASVELHFLDAAYIAGATPVSAAGQVLWAAGDSWLDAIWRYVPGKGAPELVFTSPRRDALITSVVASPAGYAFVEQSKSAFGVGGWRVWYLEGLGAEPVELARGVSGVAAVPPVIAMDDARVAWTAFDEPSRGNLVSRLGVAELANIEHPRTLLERSFAEAQIWDLRLNGDEVWYAKIDPGSDPTAAGPEYGLETLDLADPHTSPVPFRPAGHEFDPAVNDDFVVWKANERGDAALNWGTLQVLDRRANAVTTIPVEHANRPTLGSRYVAFDEITHSQLTVYDLRTGRVVDLTPAGSSQTYGGETLSGNLLTFSATQADGSGKPRIGWAILPE